jgi:hypothetical protein
MVRQFWVCDNRKITVCVDDYEDGVLKGWFYNACHDVSTFESLSQFLIRMENLLEEYQIPQSYTTHRKFSTLLRPDEDSNCALLPAKGAKATFELQVLFRQHSSWQGILVWKERKAEQSLRSVLELVILLDSALRDMEGSAAS